MPGAPRAAARGSATSRTTSGPPTSTSRPDGRFLYAAERTSSSIGAFSVDTATGKLTYLSSTPTEKQPRGFRIDPKGRHMVVSGEKSDTISVYEIDARAAALKLLQKYPTGKGSNWVEIVSFE